MAVHTVTPALLRHQDKKLEARLSYKVQSRWVEPLSSKHSTWV